jgi:hypothetical protein
MMMMKMIVNSELKKLFWLSRKENFVVCSRAGALAAANACANFLRLKK